MRLISLGIVLILTISINCFAEYDSLTFTTYYPSPYGSYNEMRVNKMSVGRAYHDYLTNIADNNLIVEGNVGIGTANPNSSKGSNGYLDVKDVYLSNVNTWASEVARTCNSSNTGIVQYNSSKLQYCNGSLWVDIEIQLTCPCGTCWSTRPGFHIVPTCANIMDICTPEGWVVIGYGIGCE